MAATLSNRRAGVGLKPQHFEQVLQRPSQAGFYEVHAENYLGDGGLFHHVLDRVREHSPITLHGVALSLGGADPPDPAHLARLRSLVRRHPPAVFSEHLAWSGHGGHYLNDLLPLAYDLATLQRVCDHIEQVQQALGLRMLLENPSTYLQCARSTMSEGQFLREVVRRTGCGLLLDVNNVYVSATNHGQDALAWLAELPLQAAGQVHLAGFLRERDAAGDPLLVDHHGSPVDDAVWVLYRAALARTGPLPTLIEWDNDVPPWPVLLGEAQRADAVLADECIAAPEAAPA